MRALRSEPRPEPAPERSPSRRCYPEASRNCCRRLERIPQKLTDFCDQNSLQHIDLARFLIARTIPFEGQAR
jgi:hypothetical protein